MDKSLLFVTPDFHCTFFYRNEFRKLGWKADLFVPYSYPEHLLWSDKDIIKEPLLPFRQSRFKSLRALNSIFRLLWFLRHAIHYDFLIFYGRPRLFITFEDKILPKKLLQTGFSIQLSILRYLGKKMVYLPTGCLEQETKENFSKFDEGNVCGNCGYFDRCDDTENIRNFRHIRRYFHLVAGWDPFNSSQYNSTHFKYKTIDLDLWHPDLRISSQHKIDKKNKILILHSSQVERNRDWKGKNIKGTPFLIEACERLKSEGHPVELIHIKDKKSNEMRFFQAQADIVVDQLIYGWWGSTGVECLALGLPVVCYIRPEWKKFFLKMFPGHSDLPIVEANTQNIYDVLKRLVSDESFRKQKGKESRLFAEKQYSPNQNAAEFSKILESL